MKRLLLPAFIFLLYFSSFSQTATQKTAAAGNDDAYNIPTTFKPFKNCWLYLASYYGKNNILVDSAWVNAQSQCVFKGKTKLTEGIYFFVSQGRVKLFDFLMDHSQHFTVSADSASAASLVITGSSENALFLNYTKYLGSIAPKMDEIQVKLKNPNLTKEASDTLQAQLAAYNKELNAYRDNLVKTHPNSLMAMLFQAMAMPEVPKMPKMANGKVDSTYPYRYFKAHYWDNVAFNDGRLLHTPIFDPKLENYFKYYVSPDPDSIIKEANYMLLYARTSKDMFQYLLGRFTDKYISPEIMGQDRVFVFLFENYFLKGDTTWLNATQKKFIFDRGYSLILNQIGGPAPALDLVDTSGKPVSLYNVKAPVTFIIFWDPTCSHCKEQVPEVDSIYEAKWKAEGVGVFAVNINDATLHDWVTFINDHHLSGWVHAYQTKEEQDAQAKSGVANFRQLYDVFQTPTMYLVDADKHIIAKRLSLLQFDGIIDAKLKQSASSKK